MRRFPCGDLMMLIASAILCLSRPDDGFAQKPAEGAKPPAAQAKAALADAIKRLEDGDIRGFIEYYLPTDQLRQLRKTNAVEQAAERIKQQPQLLDGILARLRRAAKSAPKLDPSGSVADFLMVADETPAPKAPEYKEPPVTTVKLTGFGNDLPTVLQKAEAALEKNDVESLIKNLFPAGELRHPEAESRRETLRQRLQQNPKLLEQMKADIAAVRKLKPKFSDKTDVAEFRVPGEPVQISKERSINGPERLIKFQLVEGSWRLFDNTTPARRTVAQNLAKGPPAFDQFATVEEKVTLERFGDQWRLAP